MKHFLLLAMLLSGRIWLCAQSCPVIPLPLSCSQAGAGFVISNATAIVPAENWGNAEACFLQKALLQYKGLALSLQPEATASAIVLQHSRETMAAEAYQLQMEPTRITISAATTDGLFCGIASLLQLVRTAAGNTIACWNISDAPAYAWRGLMLDESRHFFGKETVKSLLNWMAVYKLNRFHWHFTDERGWRLQVKKYPRLSLIGGIGNYDDSLAPAQYYTQETIQEIVAYAAERHIQVIPEIEMPGHASAANKAYPEFSGGGSARLPDFTFNPGRNSTYQYLTDILRETDVLFPSQMIHIGGDEVHFGNERWATDPDIRNLMQKEHLPDLKSVEQYFAKRMADSVLKLNNTVLGWDEIAGVSLPVDRSVIFWWRQEKPEQLKTALDKGFKVVLCPRLPFYFDFVQDSLHRSGRKWNKQYNSLADVYGFDAAQWKQTAGKQNQLLGIQANVWTETVRTPQRLDYLLFPRISALAEAAWTSSNHKDFADFKNRLKPQLAWFDAEGIYYYNPFEPQKHPEIIH